MHYLPQPQWNEKSKRWILRIQVNRRRKAFTSSLPRSEGKKECRQKAERWLDSFDSNGSIMFVDAFDRFLNDYHARHGDSESFRQYETIGRNHIVPKLKNYRCGEIRIEDWQSCISEAKPIKRVSSCGKTYFSSEKLCKKSLKNIRQTITAFSKWALVREYISKDVSSELYIPQDAETKGRDILQISEIAEIFQKPTDNHYERAIQFEILTGVRPGELLGLKIADYDHITGIVHIRRAISANNKITSGKNKNAQRDIILPESVRHIVEDQISVSSALHSDWLFCSPSGQHGTQRSLQKALRSILDEHGINKSITPYSLRHTFYTHTESFIPDRMIKTIFGHGDKTDSHALYGKHTIDGELKAIAGKLETTPIYRVANN